MIVRISLKYTNVPAQLYAILVVCSISVAIASIIQSRTIKDMLILLKENKDLIHTIRQILQQFPEGVIIQNFDENTLNFKTKYANSSARNEILNLDSTGTAINISDSSVKIKVLDSFELAKNMQISNFLEAQICKLKDMKENQKSINAMVALFEPSQGLIKSSDDEVKYYNIKTMKVVWEKNFDAFMHIFVDTTNVKKLEEVKAKSSCQKVMFASISHEFRTPLNAFENSLNLIKAKHDSILKDIEGHLGDQLTSRLQNNSDSIYKFIKMGKISSKLLMNLVEDILDLEKLDAKTFSNNIDSFSLSKLIEDISYIFEMQCNERGLYFEVEIADKQIMERYYESDQMRIEQVLINLISNSLKFTHEGGIKIQIEEKMDDDSAYLIFSVIDTGVGISLKDQRNLFKMFGMIQKQKKLLNQHGTGIGLAVSKKIVESLGGEIIGNFIFNLYLVISKESEGATFRFSIKVSITFKAFNDYDML